MNKKRNGAQLYKQGSIPTVHFPLSPFLFTLLCCSFATVFAVKRIIARGALSLLLLLGCCCCDFNFLCRRLRKFIEKFQNFFVIDGGNSQFSILLCVFFTHFLCRLSDALAATSSTLNPGADTASTRGRSGSV